MEIPRMDEPKHDRDRRITEFIERYGSQIEKNGGPAMAGRILAQLLVSDEPVLSSADIADALQTSSGTVSTNTRLLMHFGWVERVRMPGQRGAFFRIPPHVVDRIFDDIVENVATMRALLEFVSPVLAEGRRDRLDEMLDFYAFLEEELPGVMSRWHARQRKATPATSATSSEPA